MKHSFNHPAMTPQEVLSAAKQGNPQAIVALMNRNLKPKGITAKAKLIDGCLHIMMEGVTLPNQAAIVRYVANGIKALNVEAVKSLAIYGQVTGRTRPEWMERVELMELPPEPVVQQLETTGSSESPSPLQPSTATRIGTTASVLWTVAQSLWTKPKNDR